MLPNKSDDHVACVLVGDFAPPMFSDSWFIRNGLVAEDDFSETNGGSIDIVHKEIVQLQTSDFEIHVNRERFQVRSKDLTSSEEVMSIVASVAAAVGDSAIQQIGFNRTTRYSCKSAEVWHQIGSAFAPREIWEASIDFLESDFGNVGLKKLEYQINRDDGLIGNYKFNIFPSAPDPEFEVSVVLNDHVELDKCREKQNDFPLTNVFIQDHWRDFERNSASMISKLMQNAAK